MIVILLSQLGKLMIYRYACILEYDGSDFEAGWQAQPNKVSVQNTLTEAIYRAVQERVKVYAAGRTDKGVHAIGQVAHIDLSKLYNTQRLLNSVNFYLRKTKCIVKSIKIVDHDFHARFSSKTKTYRYCICHDTMLSVFDVGRYWLIHKQVNLDINLMSQQSKYLIGDHNFSSFRDAACTATNPVRSIQDINISIDHNKIYLDFIAQSFLHKQIRIMVGTLIDIARGHLSEDIPRILAAHDRRLSGQTAPAHGLFLMNVEYDYLSS